MEHDGEHPARFTDPAAVADAIRRRVGRRIVLGIPLGVGKPNALVNALYRLVQREPGTSLDIVTALTLEPPTWSSELERRLVQPLAERLFDGYPPLLYARDARRGALPPNVRVREFYLAPGSRMHVPRAQQDHISTNYSQVARDVAYRGVNVIAQLVAPGEVDGRRRLSLGSNPDVSLDLLDLLSAQGRRPFVVGQVNRRMPFMYGDAVVDESQLDVLLEDPALDFPLVGPPNEPIALADHAMGVHASTLVRDGGTLQIGIGAVADAVAWALRMRQTDNARYLRLVRDAGTRAHASELVDRIGGTGPFDEGLYAATEMFVPGYLALYRAGILRREVSAEEASGERAGALLHAAFFLGPRAFYDELCAMDEAERARFRMMRVSFTNRFGPDDIAQAARMQHARFLNSGLMASLLGEVASDTLDDGRVVSGVGGQHDFVAMATHLPGGRSVLMVPSTRDDGSRVTSNIRWRLGHPTVSRHLRDVLVTEYGVADLRARTDRETIEAVLSVTDARFQEGLVRQAVDAGKLPRGYRVPDVFRRNLPEHLERTLGPHRRDGTLPELPFGSDLTSEEVVLARALRRLSRAPKRRALHAATRHARKLAKPPSEARPYLERMGLDRPKDLRERAMQAAVLTALLVDGAIG